MAAQGPLYGRDDTASGHHEKEARYCVTEVYRNLQTIVPQLTALLTKMVEMGAIPSELAELHVAPFDKPRKNPHLRASKRPISLISVVMKLMETVI